MLKWFGAGVGCTGAVAFGFYALHVEGDKPIAPPVGNLELPLEREDKAIAPGATKAVATLHNRTTNDAFRPSTRPGGNPGTVRIVTPTRKRAQNTARQTQSSPPAATVGNGWTLRFVSSSSARLTTAARNSGSASGSDQEPTRTALARNIQQEMKRAGCSSKIYTHGYWDKATRSAAVRFVRNRNSAIPTARPDEALLSMLKNYRGTRCGAVQIVRPRTSRPARLKQPPRLVSRASRTAITTGWATRTSPIAQHRVNREQQGTTYVSSSTVRPSSGRTALQGPLPSHVDAQRQPGYSANGRMALGARSSYSQPGGPGLPPRTVPLAVNPGASFGPTDTNQTDGYLAPRYDEERAAALNRALSESKRRARKANVRKRRAARRRSYRRRRNRSWRKNVFAAD